MLAALATLPEAVRLHADRWALLLIVLAAVSLRLAFFYRTPVFIERDSIAYFQSGYELARGIGSDLQGRMAGYPIFLAGTIWLFGEDFHAIAFVQHALGVLTAVLAYLIGRSIFGRAAGLLAGILVALSAPLLIYEHYLLSEALFTFLLTLAVWLLVRTPP